MLYIIWSTLYHDKPCIIYLWWFVYHYHHIIIIIIYDALTGQAHLATVNSLKWGISSVVRIRLLIMSLVWPTIMGSYTISNKYATKLLQLDMNHQIKWLKAIAWSSVASIEYSNKDLFPFVASNKYQGIEFQSNLYWNLLKTLLCARSTFWKLLLPQWWEEMSIPWRCWIYPSIQFKIQQTTGSQKSD